MARLAIHHEHGTLEEWDTLTNSTDLAATAAAGMAGSDFGLEVTIDAVEDTYVTKTFPTIPDTWTVYRVRFFLDTSGLTIGASEEFTLLNLTASGGASLFRVELGNFSGATRLRWRYREDGGAYQEGTSSFTTGAARYYEARLARASSAVALDATMTVWENDVQVVTVTGADVFDQSLPAILELGNRTGVDAGTSGTFTLDEIVLDDTDRVLSKHAIAPRSPILPAAFDPVPDPQFTLSLELAGAGNGWTDVTRHVRLSAPVRWNYGISGGGIRDRVAGSGELSFTLDNSGHPTGQGTDAELGLYSPDHIAARAGFEVGIAVRVGLCYEGTRTYKKYYIDSIQPEAGINGGRAVQVTAVDWMAEASAYKLDGIAIQLGKRSDEIFTAIYEDLTRQPANVAIEQGQETFAYALDNFRDEAEAALAAFQKLALSELGYAFVKRDATDGETLVWEDRHTRIIGADPAYTFVGSLAHAGGMTVTRHRRQIWNRVQVITHNRRVDAAATTVLYSLGDATPAVGASETINPFGPFRDPNQEAARVGGTEMVTPVSGTDYTINSKADGTGTDLTGSFTVSASFGANGVRWTITNNGTETGFVTKLQARGKGVYDFARSIMEASDATSQTAYGDRVFTLDMPYQNDANTGQQVATYLLGLYKDPRTYVERIEYDADRAPDLMAQAMALDISDRIAIVEEVTGIDTAKEWFIQGCEFELTNGHHLRVGYTLAPAEVPGDQWILDQSALDDDTVLVAF